MPAGGNSRFRGYPARMSERQQLALLLQMTSQEMTSGQSSSRSESTLHSSNARSSLLQHQKGSKSRWSNKGSEFSDTSSSFSRPDDRLRIVNGCDTKDRNEFAGSPDEVRTATGAESPVAAGSPAECAAQEPATTSSSSSSASSSGKRDEEPGSEMRRTPPQNKVQGSQGQQQQGSSSSSPRVTLRLNQVRARDEKKGSATTQSGQLSASSQRQPAAAASGSMSSSQMESSQSKTSSGAPSSTNTSGNVTGPGGNNAGPTNASSSSSAADGGDVYEFKSSKEATPVRGSSTSPNPVSEKDNKDGGSSIVASSTGGRSQGDNSGSAGSGSGNVSSTGQSAVGSTSSFAASTTGTSGIGSSSTGSSATGGNNASETTSSAAAAMLDEPMTTSPQSSTSGGAPGQAKRTFAESEAGAAGDDQDEEGRKRKKKETDNSKEVGSTKGTASSRQAAGRNNSGVAEKGAKTGKQTGAAAAAKAGQSNSEKSPLALSANSPKPVSSTTATGANNQKTGAESDGEDDRSKSSDSSSAPKVPPLKIVIPPCSTSEQEQGNRNGKNTSNRGHPLPYVVASSNNSNDSMDKDQISQLGTTSGTTSPLDGASSKVGDEKKDFSGALDGESRATHHQRVLRSSHRSGNGGNGTGSNSGNGNYSNSSPLPSNAADRSNNSSPQQRHNSPTPESGNVSETGKSASTDSPAQSSTTTKSTNVQEKNEKVEVKKEPVDSTDSNSMKKDSSSDTSNTSSQAPVELHPRKRKIKTSKEAQQTAATSATTEPPETQSRGPEIHPHDQPMTNCYQLFLNIRKQIDRRRKNLFPVQPKPPQGFKDYLMNRCTYVLAGNTKSEPNINAPVSLAASMKDYFVEQEKERYRLRMQHVVEKEKLVLSVEQEILRVHGRAARALANQSVPFSVCTILKDEEVYNVITPEQEEKDRNARSRYNGRLFLSWLQDVDDKWEKIKESMLLRHHNEAESLHAVQKMDWEWKLKEVGLCEFKGKPQIEDFHVPMVHVSDDFDLLPA